LNSQELEGFEIQKKVAMPMFEDVPMMFTQMLILSGVLECPEILEDENLDTLIMSMVLTYVNFFVFLVVMKLESNRF